MDGQSLREKRSNGIVTSKWDHDMGSSKFQIKNIDTFGCSYYPGQMVAVHMSGTTPSPPLERVAVQCVWSTRSQMEVG